MKGGKRTRLKNLSWYPEVCSIAQEGLNVSSIVGVSCQTHGQTFRPLQFIHEELVSSHKGITSTFWEQSS